MLVGFLNAFREVKVKAKQHFRYAQVFTFIFSPSSFVVSFSQREKRSRPLGASWDQEGAERSG
jgi:hypothetical protein